MNPIYDAISIQTSGIIGIIRITVMRSYPRAEEKLESWLIIFDWHGLRMEKIMWLNLRRKTVRPEIGNQAGSEIVYGTRAVGFRCIYSLPSLDWPPPFTVWKPRRPLLQLLQLRRRRLGPLVCSVISLLPEAEDLAQKSQSPGALLVFPTEMAEAAGVSAAADQPHRLREPLVGGESGALGCDGLWHESGAVVSPQGRDVWRTSGASIERETSAQLH